MSPELRDKQEFVYMHRSSFDLLSKVDWYPSQSFPIVRKIAKLAKEQLDYSQRTANVDIVRHLQRIHQNMIDNENTNRS